MALHLYNGSEGSNCLALTIAVEGIAMRKTGWEEPTTGPDWIDVEMLMRALEGLHSAEVALIVSPAGTGSTGGVSIVASALFVVLPGSALPASVTVHKDWPCNMHKTLAAHCFNALHELDYRIGQTYRNEELWK
jgi:hypothetical protein